MEDKVKLFQQKAESYLCCYNSHCPRCGQCLRYEVGQYADPKQRIVTAVNPRYEHGADGTCHLFRDNQPLLMPVGMTQHFYYDMPGRIERAIKRRLIAANCRTTYYKYHRGDRPITPDVLSLITRVCREEGWQGPLQFDGEVEDYLW